MSGKIFVGNTSNIATLPKNILVGNPNNIARNVKGIYVGNSQNQAVKVWPNSRVPEGYQEVEYIRSVYRSNFFDTQVRPDSNTRIVITFMFTSIEFSETENYERYMSAPFFTEFDYTTYGNGVYKKGYNLVLHRDSTSNSSDYYFRICFDRNGDHLNYYNIYRFSNLTPWVTVDAVNYFEEKLINKKMTIDLNRSRGSLYINNEYIKTFDNTFVKTFNNLKLLSYISDTVVNNGVTNNKINLYSCQIYQNDVLIRDFIPCYHKQTYDVRLYDSVNNEFYECPSSNYYPPYLGPDV